MILQLNPAIPMTILGKGDGLALAVIDYGMEYDLLFVVAIDETGEIWTVGNPKVRALKNITQGRLIKEKKIVCGLCGEPNNNPDCHNCSGVAHEKRSEKVGSEEIREEDRKEGQEGRQQDICEKIQEKMNFMPTDY